MAVSPLQMETLVNSACRTLVVGLGETGLSVARYLMRAGAQVAIVDSRRKPPGLARLREELPADVALFLGGFRDEAFARAERIVVSPGVSPTEPAIAEAAARGVEVIGDIELFARAARAPVLAVTGSNGKSTVATLAGLMAARAGMDVRVGGNLGTPALDLIRETEPDLYVLELSSFQLETTHSLQPRVATVLNISPDHMDRYPDLAAYMQAKQRIYRGAAIQVVNADDAIAAGLAEPGRPQIRFSAGCAGDGDYGICTHEGGRWLARGGEPLLPVAAVRMAGRHNLINALAAMALGEGAGLPEEVMLQSIREFRGLPHRMQWVAESGGIRWYNDSKGTNVGATLAAIAGMEGEIVLIAGGDGKGADFTPLREAARDKVRSAVLIGRDAPQLAAVLGEVIPVEFATGMSDAVKRARALARAGDCVLLSPACASLDMYSGYQERGEVYMKAVRRLVR
jgi:UDP-N-acetylmuramoylalanine--D-glutamate ligase